MALANQYQNLHINWMPLFTEKTIIFYWQQLLIENLLNYQHYFYHLFKNHIFLRVPLSSLNVVFFSPVDLS